VRATFRVTPRIDPDRLTVADDQTFLNRLREELNLPDYVKAGLSELF
jgi:hypothetical protein